MKRFGPFLAVAALAAMPALFGVGCDDKKQAPPPPPSADPGASAPIAIASVSASASASAPIASASAAPASSKDPDSDEPDDDDAMNATSDITAENFEKEMEALDKEVSSKY